MNRHLRQHSRRLNIKTTKLASLTAVFHSKKQTPPAADDTRLSAMDVDDGHLPEQDSQVGASEAIVQEPTSQGGCSETDDDNDGRSDDDSGIEGLLVDSDSEGEFESDEDESNSDEEGADRQRDGSRAGQGILEFELRAAEAGNVLS